MFRSLLSLFVNKWAVKPEEPVYPAVAFPLSPLEVAHRYFGNQEVADNAKLKAFLGMDPAEESWCAAFVTAVERECGRKGTGSLAARSYMDYGVSTKKPVPGNIVVFWRGSKSGWEGHVGFYVKEEEDRIQVLGGNQNNSVCYTWYDKERFLGYRNQFGGKS